MSTAFPHFAPEDINLDISETNPEIIKTAKFIKNLTTSVNKNNDGNTPQIAGNNKTTRTPLLSNDLICDLPIEFEDNEYYAIGTYNDTNSKETYVHVWSSTLNHLIYRISEDNSCEIVYQGTCLNYQLKPENFIPQNRNVLFYKCQTNLFTGVSGYIRDLIFTDGINKQRFINVEDSIATKSFRWDNKTHGLKFRFSNPDDKNGVIFDQCEYIELAPRPPLKCVGIEEIQNVEPSKNNFLLNNTWQFRVKFFDVWNRESEHGVISNLYVPATSSCQSDGNGLPRCLELTIEAGSPIVSKIQIEFRKCVSTNSDIAATTDWFIYDVVDKYGDCNANKDLPWYERDITLNEFNPLENNFKYIFCGDKECTPIPVQQTNRTQNPMPITSGALARIGNGIAFANNQVGYPKVSCDIKDLLQVEYEAPAETCKPKYCDIEFYAVVHNPFVNTNEPIYNSGGIKENGGYTGGSWKWGGIGKIVANTTIPTIDEVDTDYGQTFSGQTNNQRNFYAYLEGTDFKVQGFQQQVDAGVKQDWGALSLTSNFEYRTFGREIKNGVYYVQHFVFKNVPLGKYLIRIAGHNNSMDANYQDSSTYVAGTINESNYASQDIDFNDVNTYYKELEIDTCNFTGSKFTTSTMFMICDLTAPDFVLLLNSRSNVYFGYLKDSAGKPVELSPVVIDNVTGFHVNVDASLFSNGLFGDSWDDLKNKTDHNGFWFCACASDDLIHWDTTIEFKYAVEDVVGCDVKPITFSDEVDTLNANASQLYITVSEDAVLGVPKYSLCKSVLIGGQVLDCNNKPVAGITVCYTRSKSSKTNNLGYFSILLHNDIDTDFSTVLGRDLGNGSDDDKIFLSQNGLCVFVGCTGCNMCVNIDYNVDINNSLDCFDCIGPDQKTQLYTLPTRIKFPFADQHGLKHGSTIKIGMKLLDAQGRETFVGTDDSLSVDIPKAQQQLSQLFGRLKYTMTNFTFPSWAQYVAFYWTDQNAYYNSLEFVISSVSINRQSGKIELGFQTIINYNTDNNFKTNTTWEFLKGDRIEFIADQNGQFFNANTLGVLNFQIEGNTLNTSGVIDYDKRLENLQPGTLIQLQRPKECNKDLFYYEICSPIKLTDNKRIPDNLLTGYFDIWNSYLVSRSIRYNDWVHTFPFQFEHFSPSDLWGGSCGNRGRINTINPFEQQYCKPMDVMLSDSYSTNINGLSRFDEANSHQFDDNGYGSITAMITKLQYVLFICAKSAFVVAYNDDTLKIDSQGRVVYTGAKFSKPNPQNKELGCEVVDVSTIVKQESTVLFLDRNNNAVVIHNFEATEDLSKDKFHGYIITKIDTVKTYNNDPQREFDKIFIGAQDPEKDEYLLTQFNLPRINRNVSYINEEVDINETIPETFAVNIKRASLTTFLSFTPEYYSIFNNKLISFKKGKAYNHGIRNITSFNEFYGTKTISVFDFVCNGNTPGLVKFFQWLEIYRMDKNWHASKIVTENGQLSQIPNALFENFDNFITSQFLCDINTLPNPDIPELATPAGRLMEGDTLIGKWIRIKLLSDTENDDPYFEFQEAVVFATAVQKSGEQGNPQ